MPKAVILLPARQQRLSLGCSDLMFVQWEEVEAHRPSLRMSMSLLFHTQQREQLLLSTLHGSLTR